MTKTEESSTGVSPVPHGQDAHATFRIRRGAYLPHWTQDGATYAVTFRLGDSLPQQMLKAWKFEREGIVKTAEQMGRPLSVDEEKRLHHLHSEKVERHLDAGHGGCWMAQEEIAQMVAGVLRRFDRERYDLLAWCVMPNHVHVVTRPLQGYDLPRILHSWKSFSAKKANRMLGRQGRFWHAESYDHLIRDEDDLRHCVDYVLANPMKSGLTEWQWVGAGLITDVPAQESK
jgi:REP element-mobilizing transposase RayT